MQSSVVNSFLAEDTAESARPAISDDASPVTQATGRYVSADGRTLLLDTVGMDKEGFVTGATRSFIGDRPVHFVLLLHQLRWKHERDTLLKRLEWAAPFTNNITKWAGRALFTASKVPAAKAIESDDAPPSIQLLKSLDSLHFAPLQPLPPQPRQREPSPPPPPAAPKSVGRPPAAASSAAASVALPAPSKAMLWFGAEKERLPDGERRMHDLWISLSWDCFPKQKAALPPQQWRAITSRSVIDAQRATGESLLELCLRAFAPAQAQNLSDNQHLHECVTKLGLQSHIQQLYQQGAAAPQLNPETYGDYMEALFQTLLTDKSKRQYIVAFLGHIVATANSPHQPSV